MDNTQRIIFNVPVRGVTENAGYGSVPEGVALDALNVVGFDPLEGRLRGGKRPGTGRAILKPVDGVGIPVQRMKQVTLDSAEFTDPGGVFDDPFFDIGSGPTGEGADGGWAFPPDQTISLPDLPFALVPGDVELIRPTSPDEPALSVPPETAVPNTFAEEFSYSAGELGAVSGGNWDASGASSTELPRGGDGRLQRCPCSGARALGSFTCSGTADSFAASPCPRVARTSTAPALAKSTRPSWMATSIAVARRLGLTIPHLCHSLIRPHSEPLRWVARTWIGWHTEDEPRCSGSEGVIQWQA